MSFWLMKVLQFLLDPMVEHEVMQMWDFHGPIRQTQASGSDGYTIQDGAAG